MINTLKGIIPYFRKCDRGISMLEVIITTGLILIFTGLIIPWQISSWKRTSGYSTMINANQLIEKQIEQCRIFIGMNPESNFIEFTNISDSTLWDSSSVPPIRLRWSINEARDKFGEVLENVRMTTITAKWGEYDSLMVHTAIAKNF